MNVEDRVTLCMKTFERPQCAEKLIKSIRKFYPNIRIIVADDSQDKPIDFEATNNVTHIKLPFYQGSSFGRNRALDKVKTEYFITLDDDFVFSGQTKLETWMDVLDETDIDIVGGNVDNRRYEGIIAKHKSCGWAKASDPMDVHLVSQNKGECYGLKLYDIVLQFWMGRTEKVRGLGGWDEDFKTQDHKSFFLKHLRKLKIAHCPSVFCHHSRVMPKHYVQYRHGQREQDFLQLLLEKYNAVRLVEFGAETARKK